ncbi:MAG: hypothetical protein CMJ19_16240 [Phycisphaeraceae bacterium]|nr:hypothetical protein [Phycisphaeraceae bacterium]
MDRRLAPGSLEQSVLAVMVSVLFLVLHLQSRPYKAELDNVVATATHLTLAMFFIWCTLLQTGVLGDPEDYNSLSGSGSVISIVMLLSAIGVIVIAVVLFLAETIVRRAAASYEAAKRAKWAGFTTDPPTTQWPAAKGYACFLSHYKQEAASDARFMHDMLAKMLRYPVFLGAPPHACAPRAWDIDPRQHPPSTRARPSSMRVRAAPTRVPQTRRTSSTCDR